ncbi:hypothetical protein BDA99DRAFT_562762 [Phascolomyces articulosus]|uniref:Uncharacterized protein n=1 Tax=Phascolomyces articulosus TaxID=60185 RepID=A0AAD5PAQ6_9FUNG|nr:hypothetical protein BDA99DRAFT_562762 [Phascolomyces articulosus]
MNLNMMWAGPTVHLVWAVEPLVQEWLHRYNWGKALTAGYDWCSLIGRWIAVKHSTHCIGYHRVIPLTPPSFYCTSSFVALLNHIRTIKSTLGLIVGFDTIYGPDKVNVRGFLDVIKDNDGGYLCIQGTRLYSVSYGLTDSPTSLLAWMLEKFHNWTAHPSGKEGDMHALPKSITTKEFCCITIPTAFDYFSGKLIKVPRNWLETTANLQQYNE